MATLAAKVAFLCRPDSYPDGVSRVRAVETHISWLFLADHFAFKLKKPFFGNGIDYRSQAKRRLACRRELRLNRRLAPDAYLAVCALTEGPAGLSIGGPGRAVDWLVKMRRLPESLTLERRIRARAAGPRDAESVMARLVPFFAGARSARLSPAGYRRKLLAAIDEAEDRLLRPAYGMDAGRILRIAAGLRGGVEDPAIVDAVRRAPRVVEGHGDLRPEHIYLTRPPTVIDCIEFDRRLRLRDPIEEIAFLAMECDRIGAPRMDARMFAAYGQRTGDRPCRALVEFYKAHNAFSRARIAAWHLDDPRTGPASRWRRRAREYLERAEAYLAKAGRVRGGRGR